MALTYLAPGQGGLSGQASSVLFNTWSLPHAQHNTHDDNDSPVISNWPGVVMVSWPISLETHKLRS